MKKLIILLALISTQSFAKVQSVICTDPHTNVEITIQLTGEDRLPFQFKIPKDKLLVAEVPASFEGFYALKGTLGCATNVSNPLLLSCFSEKVPMILVDSESRETFQHRSVVSFDLTEVTTRTVGEVRTVRMGAMIVFGGGLTTTEELKNIHFGNLEGTGVEGSCQIR